MHFCPTSNSLKYCFLINAGCVMIFLRFRAPLIASDGSSFVASGKWGNLVRCLRPKNIWAGDFPLKFGVLTHSSFDSANSLRFSFVFFIRCFICFTAASLSPFDWLKCGELVSCVILCTLQKRSNSERYWGPLSVLITLGHPKTLNSFSIFSKIALVFSFVSFSTISGNPEYLSTTSRYWFFPIWNRSEPRESIGPRADVPGMICSCGCEAKNGLHSWHSCTSCLISVAMPRQ